MSTQLSPLLKLYRRQGGNRGLRSFVNTLTYWSKVQFYACVTKAWVALILWLREHRNLDWRSERLLRLWHNQNDLPLDQDLLCGQTIALHPISGLLQQQPHHRIVLSRYLDSVESVPRDSPPDDANNPAYWDLSASILMAMQEYKELHDAEQHARAKSAMRKRSDDALARDDADIPAARIFEDCAAARARACARCGKMAWKYVKHRVISSAKQNLSVTYRCRRCGHEQRTQITANDILAG